MLLHTFSRARCFLLLSLWVKSYTCVYVLEEELETIRAVVQLRSVARVQQCHRSGKRATMAWQHSWDTDLYFTESLMEVVKETLLLTGEQNLSC